MIRCSNCNKELQEGMKFCDACGAQVFETVFCPNCGEQTSTEFAFCQSCGMNFAEIKTEPQTEPQQRFQSQESSQPTLSSEPAVSLAAAAGKNSSKRFPKKAAMMAGIAIAAAAVVVLLGSLFSGSGKKQSYGLYLKEGSKATQIFYSDFSKKGMIELTSRLDAGKDMDNQAMATWASSLGSYIRMNEKGTRIFFPDRVEGLYSGITLYYQDINKPKKEAEKIDSGIGTYEINKDGSKVVYLKEGKLYLHDLKDKEKIASDVSYFKVSDDFKKIGYMDYDQDYYLWTAGKEAARIAKEVTNLVYVADDFSVIYYLRDDTLYKQVVGKEDKEKIASDVARVIRVYDSGEIYYVEADTTEKRLMDYIKDDMAQADADLKEPESPTYPKAPDYPDWWSFDNDEEYEAAREKYDKEYEEYEKRYQEVRDAYSQARQEYNNAVSEKWNRDYFRENLQNEVMEFTEYTLYYYDGKEETVVTEALANVDDVKAAEKTAALIVSVYSESEDPEIKMSEITDFYNVRNQVQTALNSAADKCVAIKSELSVLAQKEADAFRISSDGTVVYFMDDISENGEGDLYMVNISKGKVGEPKLYDSEMIGRYFAIGPDNKPIYYKNEKDNEGDLFIGGEEIGSEVSIGRYVLKEDYILYFTDWNNEKQNGTLKIYKNGKVTDIAEDVHQYVTVGEEKVLYLYDYSMKSYKGTLALYHGSKSIEIDEDVIAIIP